MPKSTMNDVKIIGGMADALWFHAWGAAWSARSPSLPPPTKKTTPSTPPGADKAARDLLKLYLEINSVKNVAELAAISSDSTVNGDEAGFGHRLAYGALGKPYYGPQLTLIEPHFEITYDGDNLVWDGRDSREWEDNPRGRTARNPFIGYDADKKAIYGPDVRVKPSDAARLEPLRGYSQVLAAFDSAGKSIGWVLVEDLGFANAAEWMKATGKA